MRMIKLSDFASVTAGQGAPQDDSAFVQTGGKPFIRAGSLDMLCSGNSENDCEHISDEAAQKHRLKIYPENSILFAKSGMSAKMGRVYRLRNPAYVVSHLAIITPQEKVAEPSYLEHWFRANPPSNLIKDEAYPSIRTSEIEQISVPLPTLDEQKRIAGILDKADAIRRKRAESLKLLDELLRATFLDMFCDPITNPKGWPRVKLGAMCTIRRGASPRPISEYLGGDVPWIKIGDGSTGDPIYISETQDKIIREGVAKSVYLEPGALIFANCGVSLGFARILKIAGCIHDGWLSLEDINSDLNQLYLLKLINHLSEHFRKIAPSGTQPNLNTGIMKNYEIPLPPIHKQIEFAAIVEKAGRSQICYENAYADTDKLFHSLVARAFKGEL